MKRKVIKVTTIVTALLDCGHVVNIDEAAKLGDVLEHRCYKCEEQQAVLKSIASSIAKQVEEESLPMILPAGPKRSELEEFGDIEHCPYCNEPMQTGDEYPEDSCCDDCAEKRGTP